MKNAASKQSITKVFRKKKHRGIFGFALKVEEVLLALVIFAFMMFGYPALESSYQR